MTTTYNGWANRETWVFNLHLGDQILEQLLDLADRWLFRRCRRNRRHPELPRGLLRELARRDPGLRSKALASFIPTCWRSPHRSRRDRPPLVRRCCTKLEELGYTVDTEEGTFELDCRRRRLIQTTHTEKAEPQGSRRPGAMPGFFIGERHLTSLATPNQRPTTTNDLPPTPSGSSSSGTTPSRPNPRLLHRPGLLRRREERRNVRRSPDVLPRLHR